MTAKRWFLIAAEYERQEQAGDDSEQLTELDSSDRAELLRLLHKAEEVGTTTRCNEAMEWPDWPAPLHCFLVNKHHGPHAWQVGRG